MDSVTLISADNHKIKLDLKSAQKSTLLKQKLLDTVGRKNKTTLEIQLKDIKYDILKVIVEYLNYYKNRTPKEIPKPVPSESLSAFLDDWDFEFINKIGLDNIFDLMNAASDLGIPSLLDLASTKVASILKNRGVEDIRNMFNTGCDLSPKELNEYAQLQNL